MENIDEYIALYIKGVPSKDIAKTLQLQNHTFDEFIHTLRDKFLTKTGRLTSEMKDLIFSRFQHSVKCTEIARELQLNYKTVRKVIDSLSDELSFKEFVTFDDICELTPFRVKRIDKDTILCPLTNKKAKRVMSELSEDAYYCIASGEEYHVVGDLVYHVKWENVN